MPDEKKRTGPVVPQKLARFSLVCIPIIALFLLSSPELSFATFGIKLDVRPGVSSTQVKHLTLAINDVFRYFSDNYKLALQKRMRIIVVPDDDVFETVLRTDFNKSPATAKKMAKLSTGMAKEFETEYLLVVKARESKPLVPLMRRTCHEIIHWFQYRAGGHKKTGQHKWIAEGVATIVAYHIVEPYQTGELDKYRQDCLKTLKKAAQIPSFKDLSSRKDWDTGMEKYGSKVVYSKAGLAVLELADRKGINSLFDYYLHLAHQTPAKAFEKAFQMNLQQFESEMDQKFAK